ncbi:hypothetical protein LCGC14_1423200 [marine sediment metagenome]|uniref:Uncharacterized protein n=1 Tax=marine sediment metagenome TaxID=412755 RepID=A0A0F9JQJ6_9ZZZZ
MSLRDQIAEALYGELTYKNYLATPGVRLAANKRIDQILSLIIKEVGEIKNPHTKTICDFMDRTDPRVCANLEEGKRQGYYVAIETFREKLK